jgi:hypothetical protein
MVAAVVMDADLVAGVVVADAAVVVVVAADAAAVEIAAVGKANHKGHEGHGEIPCPLHFGGHCFLRDELTGFCDEPGVSLARLTRVTPPTVAACYPIGPEVLYGAEGLFETWVLRVCVYGQRDSRG